jgi:hypothetical protein
MVIMVTACAAAVGGVVGAGQGDALVELDQGALAVGLVVEVRGHGHQLGQVAEAVARLLGVLDLEALAVAGALDGLDDDLGHRGAAGGHVAQAVDDARRSRASFLRARGGDDDTAPARAAARRVEQDRPATRAWARTRSTVVLPMPRVGTLTTRSKQSPRRVEHQPQVGEHVLDLAALEERDAADDAIVDAVAAQLLLEHARLGVGAVEDGDVAPARGPPRRPGRTMARAMKSASARSSGPPPTRIRSPPLAVGPQVLAVAIGLRAMTALAASRMTEVER